MVKLCKCLGVAVIMLGSVMAKAQINSNYAGNRQPLTPTPFIALPIKSVSAKGWLLTQLLNQKSGLTGNAEILYNELKDNAAWLGGNAPDSDWERPTYYVKGLIALAYVLNDSELINKSTKWIDWAINSQQENGFFGPPGNTDWWSRMPMLYALKDHFEATGDDRVIPFLKSYFEYQNNFLEINPLNAWARSRAGDNIEIVFWLYNRTGDSFLLDLADKLENQAYNWTDILTNNKFMYFGTDFQPKHNVNVPQAMKMPAIIYQKTNLLADRDAFQKGYSHLMHDHGQPYGMPSGSEMLNGVSAMTGVEACSIVEQMQSCETAQMILGDPAIGDILEEVAYNALPGAFTKDFKGHSYYIQANQVINVNKSHGFEQDYPNALMQGPYSGFPCCRFNIHMGWPYFVKNMWAATNDGGLAIMAYGPSQVTALVADGVDVTIDEITNYPFDDHIVLNITLSNEAVFPLKFRIPAWCENPEIRVNGTIQEDVASGTFYSINRNWKNNDAVEIRLPMNVEVKDRVNNALSVHRGPLVYSLEVDEEWIPVNDFQNDFYEYETKPASDWNYALVLDKDNPEASITVNEGGIMPENPYVQSTTPVSLSAKGEIVPSWTLTRNGAQAYDPPFGPVATTGATENITLIPFGAQTLRVTTFPYVGTPTPVTEEFADAFDDGNWDGWVIYNGEFYIENGEFFITNPEGGSCLKAVQTATRFSDLVYETKIQLNSSKDNAGILFRVTNPSTGVDAYNGYYAGISAEGYVVLGKSNGSWTQLKNAAANVSSSNWHKLKVVAIGSNIKVYFDNMDEPIIDVDDNSFSEGSIGVRSWKTPVKFDGISVNKSIANGIVPLIQDLSISIFPNPTEGQCQVVSKDNLMVERVAIYDVTGNRIKTFKEDVFSLSDLANGVYFANVHTETRSKVLKLIKK